MPSLHAQAALHFFIYIAHGIEGAGVDRANLTIELTQGLPLKGNFTLNDIPTNPSTNPLL